MNKKLLIAVAAVVVVLGGGFIGIKLWQGDPEERLTLEDTAASESTDTTASGASSGDTSAEGTWNVTSQSIVGYRVKETLFGSATEAVGRTSEVEGSMTINGTTVSAANFTVDMASVSSDRAQRDGQFRTRIMNTSQFPTATFKLTSPIALSSVADGEEIDAKATGDLNLHGVTNKVTFDVVAKKTGGEIRVNGSITIAFDDYDISDPSGGPAQVDADNGVLEFTLVFAK